MKNNTTFHRVEKNEKYTVISNSLITSKSLSSDEKIILFHILSLPDDWNLYKSYLENYYSGNITQGKFDKAWKGLIVKGYLKGIPCKNKNGKFDSWSYEVWEIPITDTPKIEESENRVVENTTTHNLGDKQNTNEQITNELTNNLNNTSIILGKNEIKKKNYSDKEIQLELNLQYFNNIFKNSGIDWQTEIKIIPFENFIQKFIGLSSNTGDDYNLRFNLNNYYKLSGLDNPQLPRGE